MAPSLPEGPAVDQPGPSPFRLGLNHKLSSTLAILEFQRSGRSSTLDGRYRLCAAVLAALAAGPRTARWRWTRRLGFSDVGCRPRRPKSPGTQPNSSCGARFPISRDERMAKVE